jgi:hypothetical protein
MADQITPQPGTEASNPIDAAKVAPSTTSFGFSSVSLPTPKWANAAFDYYFIVTTAFLGWMAADSLFTPIVTKHLFYFITLLLTPMVKGLSKMFGVKIDNQQ